MILGMCICFSICVYDDNDRYIFYVGYLLGKLRF